MGESDQKFVDKCHVSLARSLPLFIASTFFQAYLGKT